MVVGATSPLKDNGAGLMTWTTRKTHGSIKRRVIGAGGNVLEFILRLTHTVQMDWFAPGIAPTGRRLVVPHVGIVAFEGGRISSEHIYWDQATVLLQLGILEGELPVLGTDQADRLLDPNAPANTLIKKL